jgi:hypothetical protein
MSNKLKNFWTMRTGVTVLSLPLLTITLLAGAFGAYEILTSYAGFSPEWAWGAAIVIDLTGLWLAFFTTILAKTGAAVTSIKRSTYFVICVSVLLNAFHGWTVGSQLGTGTVSLIAGGVGALVSAMFPIFSAMIFHYNLTLITFEYDKEAGHILPRKPTLPKGKYRNKAREKEIMTKHANLQYDFQDWNMEREKAEQQNKTGQSERTLKAEGSVPNEQTNNLEIRSNEQFALRSSERTNEQTNIEVANNEQEMFANKLNERTNEQVANEQLKDQVDQLFAEQTLQNIAATMTLKEAIEALLDAGIEDPKKLQAKIAEQNILDRKGNTPTVEAVRTTKNRILNSRTN